MRVPDSAHVDLPEIITREEAARWLRIGLSTLDELIRERKLRASRIGRRVLIKKSDLLKTLEACEKL